jgi:hypothetical protein
MSDDRETIEVPLAKSPIRFRRLRIAVSVFFGLVAVLLIVLWVRSDSTKSSQGWSFGRQTLRLTAVRGEIGCLYRYPLPANSNLPWTVYEQEIVSYAPASTASFTPTSTSAQLSANRRSSCGFELLIFGNGWQVVSPFWLLVTCSVLVAAIAGRNCIRISSNFSLRTLLLTTTLIALVLGAVVVMLR